MSPNNRERRVSYHLSKTRFCMSIMIIALSIILAFLLLRNPLFLTYYFISMFIVTISIFVLRIRLTRIRVSQLEKTSPETEEGTHGLKTVLLMVFALIAFLALPLFLAKLLDPYIWFTLLISFMTGYSLADIVFQLYTRR